MTTRTMPLVDLGILSLLERASGTELKRGLYGSEIFGALGRMLSISRPSRGGTYKMLDSLEREGLIGSVFWEGEHGPVRRTYLICDEGREKIAALSGTLPKAEAAKVLRFFETERDEANRLIKLLRS